MVLSLQEVIALKQELSERFGVILHLHGVCGSQSFSFDESIGEDAWGYLEIKLSALGGSAQLSQDRMGFRLLP